MELTLISRKASKFARGVVRSLSLTIEFPSETHGEFTGVLGAEPLGEGEAEAPVASVSLRKEACAQGGAPPSFFLHICKKSVKSLYYPHIFYRR